MFRKQRLSACAWQLKVRSHDHTDESIIYLSAREKNNMLVIFCMEHLSPLCFHSLNVSFYYYYFIFFTHSHMLIDYLTALE